MPFFECAIDRIDAMVDQPRQHFDNDRLTELTNSIRASGIIQPLVVRRAGDRFMLIAGERRLRAARLAGLQSVPVVVREDVDMNAFELALIENIQREDLNALEEARAYERLLHDSGLTHDQLADRVGKSRTTVTNSLRLLRLPPTVAAMLEDGSISAGHARAVLSVDPALQSEVAERILSGDMSVRQAEALAAEIKAAPAPAPTAPKPARPEKEEMRPQLKRVVEQLRQQFGQRVELRQRPNGTGRLEIHFANEQALKSIVDALMGLEP
jgi:ParB family chromosome partitioning protein